MAFKSKPTPSIGVVASPSVISNTVASGTTHVIVGMSLANVNTSVVTASVKLNKSGGTSSFIVKDAVVPLGGALIPVGADQKVVLEEGDTITAYSSIAASVDAILSYLV